jgi:transcriptional regulator with XRE-family HTH domain
LARELTVLRQRAGLSLTALARRTTASRSSWHRYLNGAQLPPPALVAELCALADEPPGRLLALRDLADPGGDPVAAVPPYEPATEDDTTPHAPLPVAETGHAEEAERTAPTSSPRRRALLRRLSPARLVVTALASAVTLTAAVGASTVLRDSGGTSKEVGPGCRGTACTGRPSQPMACAVTGAGTRTVAEHRPPREQGPSMDIRYSSGCDATWARVWFGQIGDGLEITAPGQAAQTAEIRDRFDAENYLSTPMIGGGPEGFTACLIPSGASEHTCVTS